MRRKKIGVAHILAAAVVVYVLSAIAWAPQSVDAQSPPETTSEMMGGTQEYDDKAVVGECWVSLSFSGMSMSTFVECDEAYLTDGKSAADSPAWECWTDIVFIGSGLLLPPLCNNLTRSAGRLNEFSGYVVLPIGWTFPIRSAPSFATQDNFCKRPILVTDEVKNVNTLSRWTVDSLCEERRLVEEEP